LMRGNRTSFHGRF